MTTTAFATDPGGLIGGGDTHADTHTLAILTANGGVLCTETFPATTAGYDRMITTLEDAGLAEITAVETAIVVAISFFNLFI